MDADRALPGTGQLAKTMRVKTNEGRTRIKYSLNSSLTLIGSNLAGGDAKVLMTSLSTTLVAISAGAVFMGANTCIGNAPNFMVRSVAQSRGVRMPGFFGYMLWSGAIRCRCSGC